MAAKDVVINIGARDRASSVMARVGRNVRNMSRAVQSTGRQLRNSMSRVSNSIDNAGNSLMRLALVAGAAGYGVVDAFGRFDQSMQEVMARSGNALKNYENAAPKLAEQAKNLGRTTRFTASEIADSMAILAAAGLDVNEIISATPQVLNMASAANLDIAQTAGIATTVLRAFGLEASQMASVADAMAAGSVAANMTLADMGETMKYLAPLAAAAGQNVNEVVTAMALAAQRGISGSMAGTNLAMVFTQLADSGVQEKLAEMGVAVTDAEGNFLPFIDIVKQLKVAMEDMPQAERLSFLKELFDQRGMRVMSAIMGSTNEEIDAMRDKLYDVDGAAKDMSDTIESSLFGALRRVRSAFEGVFIAAGEMLKPKMIQIAESLANALNDITDNAEEVVGKFLEVIKAGAGLVVTYGHAIALAVGIRQLAFIFGTILGPMYQFQLVLNRIFFATTRFAAVAVAKGVVALVVLTGAILETLIAATAFTMGITAAGIVMGGAFVANVVLAATAIGITFTQSLVGAGGLLRTSSRYIRMLTTDFLRQALVVGTVWAKAMGVAMANTAKNMAVLIFQANKVAYAMAASFAVSLKMVLLQSRALAMQLAGPLLMALRATAAAVAALALQFFRYAAVSGAIVLRVTIAITMKTLDMAAALMKQTVAITASIIKFSFLIVKVSVLITLKSALLVITNALNIAIGAGIVLVAMMAKSFMDLGLHTETVNKLSTDLSNSWNNVLWPTFKKVFGGITEMFMKGDYIGAFKAAWYGIKIVIFEVLFQMMRAINDFVGNMSKMLMHFFTNFIEIAQDAANMIWEIITNPGSAADWSGMWDGMVRGFEDAMSGRMGRSIEYWFLEQRRNAQAQLDDLLFVPDPEETGGDDGGSEAVNTTKNRTTKNRTYTDAIINSTLGGDGMNQLQQLQATESRLLTRGQSQGPLDKILNHVASIDRKTEKPKDNVSSAGDTWETDKLPANWREVGP